MVLFKSKRRFAALVIASALVAGGGLFAVFYGRAPRTAVAPPARVVTQNGAAVVALDPGAQAQNGIRVDTLPTKDYHPRAEAYGIVLDMQPLLDLRIRIIAAKENLEGARARESASRREYKRLMRLARKDGNVSRKVVEAEEALWKIDLARRTGARDTLARLRRMARIEWGKVLGGWASNGDPGGQADLMDGRSVLVLVTISPETVIKTPPTRVYIQAGGDGRETDARLVSAAPRTDSFVQGATYFYRMASGDARIGMRLSVGVPSPGGALRGIFLPDSAIVWYAGRPWAYIAVDAWHFRRQGLAGADRVQKGWFASGFGTHPRVVVEGAQLLLSQELQPELRGYSGPTKKSEENDDDDD